MNLKKTKQPIMGLAALLIIFFHLFPIPRSSEIIPSLFRYSVMTAYIGVDIFFFMAGYMSVFSDTKNYLKYIKKKFINVYPIFILSCIIVVMAGKLYVKQAAFTLMGIELFKRGGSSFLWFIPAIMIFYLIVPLYIKLINKLGRTKTFISGMVLWTVIMFALEWVTENHNANIFLCRIPIILIGIFASQYEGELNNKTKAITSIVLLAVGIFLTWKFGYMIKANFLVTNIFYVIVIPNVIGTLLFADMAFSKYRARVLEFLGEISLELYCFQMIIGLLLFGVVASFTKNAMLSFFIVVVLVILFSYLTSVIKKRIFSINSKFEIKKEC